MELPPELTRVPLVSLDVLRYLGRSSVTSGSAEALAQAIGMSERTIGKAIRGLVTKGYFSMDSAYVYHLTEKGAQAVRHVAAYDAAHAGEEGQIGPAHGIEEELAAVVVNPLASGQSATLEIGIPGRLDNSRLTQLVLRFSAAGGNITPSEITLDLHPGQYLQPARAEVKPTSGQHAMRVRVEAVQLVDETEIHAAGGMFFDIEVADRAGNPCAWYTDLLLQE